MAKYTKPLVNKVWGATSTKILAPSDSKIATGWLVEKPPLQTFNFLDNKQDTMLAYLNQQGIPEWDSNTEYQAGSSFVQGSDGLVYRAVDTHVNYNPVGDAGTHWLLAFAQVVGVPASAGAAGVKGSFAQSSSFLYICTANHAWKRVSISSW